MAKCPECGDPDAYVGMNSVECASRLCKRFTEQQLADYLTRKLNEPKGQEVLDSDDLADHKPVYLWCHSFHDFGD